jgi:hypothetical protein
MNPFDDIEPRATKALEGDVEEEAGAYTRPLFGSR